MDVMCLSYVFCLWVVGWIVGKEDVVLLGTVVGNSVSKKNRLATTPKWSIQL